MSRDNIGRGMVFFIVRLAVIRFAMFVIIPFVFRVARLVIIGSIAVMIDKGGVAVSVYDPMTGFIPRFLDNYGGDSTIAGAMAVTCRTSTRVA